MAGAFDLDIPKLNAIADEEMRETTLAGEMAVSLFEHLKANFPNDMDNGFYISCLLVDALEQLLEGGVKICMLNVFQKAHMFLANFVGEFLVEQDGGKTARH